MIDLTCPKCGFKNGELSYRPKNKEIKEDSTVEDPNKIYEWKERGSYVSDGRYVAKREHLLYTCKTCEYQMFKEVLQNGKM